mgnify:CR=1 FL=1
MVRIATAAAVIAQIHTGKNQEKIQHKMKAPHKHRPIDHSRDKEFPLLPRLIATSCGFGYLPVAPGTWGAIFGIILWLPLYIWVSPAATVAITAAAVAILTIAGTWASSVSAHDAACEDAMERMNVNTTESLCNTLFAMVLVMLTVR